MDILMLIIMRFLILFFTVSYLGHAAMSLASTSPTSHNGWSEILLYETLLQKELKELRSLPDEFKSAYEEEITQKNRSFALLSTILKIRAGIIKAEGPIPTKFKVNPYSKDYEQTWNTLIIKVEALPKIDCNTIKSKFCAFLVAKSENERIAIFNETLNKDIFTAINKNILTNNWKASLKITYENMDHNPSLKLVYDVIQRLYSFKHQGAGNVAIKGM
jgi:hypothetical protein